MGEKPDTLTMTVHLLANSGDALLLQQILDHLFQSIWPDIQLFLVSEHVSSIKYFERYPKKRSGFPGMSVLLFLHEDLGEERISHTLNFFQNPPWQYHHTENANGRPCPYVLVRQDFYCLDAHMPVWGVRQVHYGTEILRVTVYCSFENYDDAVRLYELILQKEATAQKSSFCFFVLHSTKNMSVQLSLKQMPVGVPVEVKESSILQFKVQEIGQLVPLLPNPCIPISSTRWQTQDYDGNKILLQVQGSTSENHDFLAHPKKSTNEEKTLLSFRHCSRNQFSNWETTDRKDRELFCLRAGLQNWRFQTGKPHASGEPSEHSESLASESPCGTPRSDSISSSQCSSPAVSAQCTILSTAECSSQENHNQTQEEVNVDTGFVVVLSECSPSPLTRFSRDLYNNLPHRAPPQNCSPAVVGSRIKLPSENPSHKSSFAVESYKGAGKGTVQLHLQPSQKNHGNGADEEEEFFI